MEKVHTASTASDNAMKSLFDKFERAKDTLQKDFNRAKETLKKDFNRDNDALSNLSNILFIAFSDAVDAVSTFSMVTIQ